MPRNRLNIRWQDKVSDTEVLKQKTSQASLLSQLRWAGHISRMPDDRIPKQLLYEELCQGKSTVGAQRKQFSPGSFLPRTDPRGAILDLSFFRNKEVSSTKLLILCSVLKIVMPSMFLSSLTLAARISVPNINK